MSTWPDGPVLDARAGWLIGLRAGTARPAGNDNGGAPSGTYHWRRGDGDDTVVGGGGGDRLRLWNTLLTLPDLLGAIRVDPGLPRPVLTPCGGIDVRGVTGRIVLGRETVTFHGLDELVLGNVLLPD
ncbi:hypothetical protein ACLF3G_01925 [Falsiroseomonas sp. HC035]|uniref:hypothetical protein n=1 Tax=Falsiroseomonas sp. HC035 TaxID=3390999 RepID=UPI003D31110F